MLLEVDRGYLKLIALEEVIFPSVLMQSSLQLPLEYYKTKESLGTRAWPNIEHCFGAVILFYDLIFFKKIRTQETNIAVHFFLFF